MGANTKIEWTAYIRPDGTSVPGHTFNPWRGCTKVSDGCKNCYAETLTHRWGLPVWGPTAGRVIAAESAWRNPLSWDRKARAAGERHRVFCASLADVFEGNDTCKDKEAWADITGARMWLFQLIEETPNLDWLLLTKRPQNILDMVPLRWANQFPANVWIGTSVEDQKTADTRIPLLLEVPAVVRFLSCEPLLSSVCLSDEWLYPRFAADDPRYYCPDGRGVDWVIIGGESGPGARPAHLNWYRKLVSQCRAVGVPAFVKQMGSYAVDDARQVKFVDRKGGDITEFPEELRVREFPGVLAGSGDAALAEGEISRQPH